MSSWLSLIFVLISSRIDVFCASSRETCAKREGGGVGGGGGGGGGEGGGWGEKASDGRSEADSVWLAAQW